MAEAKADKNDRAPAIKSSFDSATRSTLMPTNGLAANAETEFSPAKNPPLSLIHI